MKILGTCLGIGILSSIAFLTIFSPNNTLPMIIAGFGSGCWALGVLTAFIIKYAQGYRLIKEEE